MGNLVGQSLAHFRIVEKLGEGGMGVVYRATDEKLRRSVALKVLPDSFAKDDDRRRRFLREARSAAAVTHANIATVHDVGEADGHVFIAMELVEGETLGAATLAEALEQRAPAWTADDVDWMQVKLLYSRHQAGLSTDAEFRSARDAIEHDTIKRLGGRGKVWEIAVSLWLYAEFAESPDEVSDALPYIAKAEGAEGTLQTFGGRVGKVYLMAGKTDAALVSLRRSAGMCTVTSQYRSGRQTIAYMHARPPLVRRSPRSEGGQAGRVRGVRRHPRSLEERQAALSYRREGQGAREGARVSAVRARSVEWRSARGARLAKPAPEAPLRQLE
jgi:hypothetical protein